MTGSTAYETSTYIGVMHERISYYIVRAYSSEAYTTGYITTKPTDSATIRRGYMNSPVDKPYFLASRELNIASTNTRGLHGSTVGCDQNWGC